MEWLYGLANLDVGTGVLIGLSVSVAHWCYANVRNSMAPERIAVERARRVVLDGLIESMHEDPESWKQTGEESDHGGSMGLRGGPTISHPSQWSVYVNGADLRKIVWLYKHSVDIATFASPRENDFDLRVRYDSFNQHGGCVPGNGDLYGAEAIEMGYAVHCVLTDEKREVPEPAPLRLVTPRERLKAKFGEGA